MPSIARHHNEWLSLPEISGLFLSKPVLRHSTGVQLELGISKSATAATLQHGRITSQVGRHP